MAKHWDIGNNDGAGASLTKAEIDKVVSYVQSPGFQARYNKSQSGKVVDASLAKDIWFYLSPENIKYKGKKILGKEAALQYIKAQINPAEIKAAPSENIFSKGN